MSLLSSVVLKGYTGTITLPVLDAKPDDMYILTSADGLGPPDINVALGQSVYRGGVFQGSYPQAREIVLYVTLNPNYFSQTPKSVADLRASFYRLIEGSEPITIILNSKPEGIMQVSGYIKNIDIIPFTKDPVIQVTLTCPWPYFNSPTVTQIDVPPTPSFSGHTIEYTGTALAGVEYEFRTTAAMNDMVFAVYSNNALLEYLWLSGTRAANEKFKITTSPTGRQVYWTSANGANQGDVTGMCEVADDKWPMLHPGTNLVTVLDGTGLQQSVISLLLRYTNRYWGV